MCFVWVGLYVGGLVSFGWIACKWYFVCVGLRGKILRSVVGAVPVCPPVSPRQGRICCHLCAGVALSFDVEKVVFIFICIFASNKNVNQEQSWNV